jgi:hypothetical protein
MPCGRDVAALAQRGPGAGRGHPVVDQGVAEFGARAAFLLAVPEAAVVEYDVAGHWQSVDYFTDMVGRFRRIGIDEFVLCWPQTRRDRPSEQTVFDEVTHDVMPEMRATG